MHYYSNQLEQFNRICTAINMAEYMIKTRCTYFTTAAMFGVSVSTVRRYIKSLEQYPEYKGLYEKVQSITTPRKWVR